MSASLMPAWGRACGALSILTTSAARAGTAGSAGSPVNGSALAATGGAVLVEEAGAVVEELASFFFPPPLQAAPTSDTTTRATVSNPARGRRGVPVTAAEATRARPALLVPSPAWRHQAERRRRRGARRWPGLRHPADGGGGGDPDGRPRRPARGVTGPDRRTRPAGLGRARRRRRRPAGSRAAGCRPRPPG